MINKVSLTVIQKDYIKRRRFSVFIFYGLFYAFCILMLLIRFKVIKFGGTIITAPLALVILSTIASLINISKCKRYYKKIEMPNHNEIIVFRKRELFALLIPIFISACFIWVQIIGYIILAGTIYYQINKFNRPYHPLEDKHKFITGESFMKKHIE